MLQGIDVSSYQGKVDWDGWKRKGLGFAIAKATEGRTIRDSQFARNWSELRRVGLVRGAYHFAHPANDATTEADFFLGTVRPKGLESGDLLVLDLEQTDGRSASHVASWARTWCSRVAKAVGCDPVVYTFLSFAEEGNCAGLGAYPLWIADPSRTAGRPRVPAPWQRWLLHQYDVDPIDADVANVSSAADLRAYGIGGGDDTGIVVSLGAGRDQSVAPGATESIEWHTEYTDKHGLHAADGSSVMVDRSYWALADALVRVSGLRPADPVDIMWTRMTRDGTAVKDDAWRVTYRADPDGTLTASHSGQVGVGSDVRFRLRVYNPNPVPITVSGATTAKITLLSY